MRRETAVLISVVSFACSGSPAAANTTRARYGAWIVTSSQTSHDGEVGGYQIHHNVYRRADGSEKLVASFTGDSQSDGGKTSAISYAFADSKAGFQVTETRTAFEAVWAIDKAGSVGLKEQEITQKRWDGQAFVATSSIKTLNLSRLQSNANVEVRVGKKNGVVIAADRQWGIVKYRIRFADGQEAVFDQSSLSLR
jgi:hypothetical protein